MQIAIVIAEEADFQIFDQPPNLFFIQQQRRHRDQRCAILGNVFGKIEFR